MIRRLGSHSNRRIYFGYDRYVLPDLEAYLELMGTRAEVICAVDRSYLHYLTSAELVCKAVQADEDSIGILCCGTGLGMSIVPNACVAEPTPHFIVRPLNPPVPCTLALVEHRNKPNDPALERSISSQADKHRRCSIWLKSRPPCASAMAATTGARRRCWPGGWSRPA